MKAFVTGYRNKLIVKHECQQDSTVNESGFDDDLNVMSIDETTTEMMKYEYTQQDSMETENYDEDEYEHFQQDIAETLNNEEQHEFYAETFESFQGHDAQNFAWSMDPSMMGRCNDDYNYTVVITNEDGDTEEVSILPIEVEER